MKPTRRLSFSLDTAKNFLLLGVATGLLTGFVYTNSSAAIHNSPAIEGKSEAQPVLALSKNSVIERIKHYANIYNVPWQVAVAVHLHESGDGKWLYRYEPGKMRAAARYSNYAEEQRMLASSHGPMHVLGLTANDYGVHWSELYSDTGIEFGVMYLAKCWGKHKKLSKVDRVVQTLLDYNGRGNPLYPSKVIAKLKPLLTNKKV